MKVEIINRRFVWALIPAVALAVVARVVRMRQPVVREVASERAQQLNEVRAFWTAQGHNRIGFDGRVEDVATRRPLAPISLPGQGAPVRDIQTSADGRVVVVQLADGRVLIRENRWF